MATLPSPPASIATDAVPVIAIDFDDVDAHFRLQGQVAVGFATRIRQLPRPRATFGLRVDEIVARGRLLVSGQRRYSRESTSRLANLPALEHQMEIGIFISAVLLWEESLLYFFGPGGFAVVPHADVMIQGWVGRQNGAVSARARLNEMERHFRVSTTNILRCLAAHSNLSEENRTWLEQRARIGRLPRNMEIVESFPRPVSRILTTLGRLQALRRMAQYASAENTRTADLLFAMFVIPLVLNANPRGVLCMPPASNVTGTCGNQAASTSDQHSDSDDTDTASDASADIGLPFALFVQQHILETVQRLLRERLHEFLRLRRPELLVRHGWIDDSDMPELDEYHEELYCDGQLSSDGNIQWMLMGLAALPSEMVQPEELREPIANDTLMSAIGAAARFLRQRLLQDDKEQSNELLAQLYFQVRDKDDELLEEAEKLWRVVCLEDQQSSKSSLSRSGCSENTDDMHVASDVGESIDDIQTASEVGDSPEKDAHQRQQAIADLQMTVSVDLLERVRQLFKQQPESEQQQQQQQ